MEHRIKGRFLPRERARPATPKLGRNPLLSVDRSQLWGHRQWCGRKATGETEKRFKQDLARCVRRDEGGLGERGLHPEFR